MKNKLTARLAVVAALVAVTAPALSGCSSSNGSSAGGTTTLKLVVGQWGTAGSSNDTSKYFQGMIDAFHKKNPDINVDVTAIAWTEWDQQVQTMIQNKQYPDITQGDYFSNYAKDGLLYPASQVLSDPSNLLPVFKEHGSYDGTQYGMPSDTSSRTLFYNTKLFSAAGITSAPRTWNDIETAAAAIKAKGATGFGLPLGKEEAQAESLLWMLGAGGGYQTDGKYTINSPANVKAFTFLKQLVSAGDTEPHPGTVNRTDLWQKFAQGQVGMVNGSPALIPIIQSAGVLKDSDWASVPVAGENGPLDTTVGVSDYISAFKPNGHEAQIKKFLDFAYQDKYQLQFAKLYALLPATTTAVNALKSDPVFGPFLAALPKSAQYPSDTPWANVRTKIQQTIGTAVTGDPMSVLTRLQQTATSGQK